MNYFTGIFFILHGLVHLLYMGHSLNYFELEKGFTWPENSRLFRSVLDSPTIKKIAAALCVVAALGFMMSGIFMLTGYSRVNLAILVSVTASTVLYIAFWDASTHKMHTQGGVALLINMLILIYVFF